MRLKIPTPHFSVGKLSQFRLSRSDYTVSIFGQLTLAVGALLYGYGMTFDLSNAEFQAFTTMAVLLLVGVLFTCVFVGVPKFIGFSKKSLAADAISTGVSVACIYVVNQLLPFTGSASPISDTAFVTLSGVTEEWVFRMWLCCWLYKITGSVMLATGISSGIWAVYHTARYGGEPWLMLVIFLCGLPLGAMTLLFRSSDGPSFAHMLMNALASR
jgi:hypothetical protein